MKYVNQLMIISVITFFGEMLNRLLPFPVPGGVYGLLILFLCLCLKIIKLDQVDEVADFFVRVMPVFFIAPSVMIMTVYQEFSNSLLAFLIITIISTVTTMGVTGVVAQFVIKRNNERRMKDE